MTESPTTLLPADGINPEIGAQNTGLPEQRKPLTITDLPGAVSLLIGQDLGNKFDPNDPREQEYDFLSAEITRLIDGATEEEQGILLEQYRRLDKWYSGQADKLDVNVEEAVTGEKKLGPKAEGAKQAQERGDIVSWLPAVLNPDKFQLGKQYSLAEATAKVAEILATDYWKDYDINRVINDASALTAILRQYPYLKGPFYDHDYVIRLQRSQSPTLPEAQIPPHPYMFALGTILYKFTPNIVGTPVSNEELLQYADGQREYIQWDFERQYNPVYSQDKDLQPGNRPPAINSLRSFIELTGAHRRLTVTLGGEKGKIVRISSKGIMIKMQGGDTRTFSRVEEIMDSDLRFVDKIRDRNFFRSPQS